MIALATSQEIRRPRTVMLKPRRIDYSKLGTLHDKIDPEAEPFDIRRFRDDREGRRAPVGTPYITHPKERGPQNLPPPKP